MDLAGFSAVLTPAGQALLAEAAGADLGDTGLLATTARLRARHPAELVAAALTQVRLRARAREKFGADADLMYFTPDGLEQATGAGVAALRARRFAALAGPAAPGGTTGATTGPAGDPAAPDPTGVLDLCCGIGGDLIALARAGCAPTGIDADPLTVAVARANVAALGLAGGAAVRLGDVTAARPARHAAAFADPARRTARGRVFDPRAYRPPLDAVLDLVSLAPGGCVKVAPGIPYEAVPAGAEVEWISVRGEVKEAAIWLGALAGAVPRRATLLAGPSGARGPATLTPDPGLGDAPVGPWRRYLYEPDGAVIRAHLVAEVAADVAGSLADPRIAYITSDTLKTTPFATAYEIHDVLPFSVKRLRQALRTRRAGTVTIKKRGSAVDIERLRRDLRPAGPERATVVLTRVGTDPVALLCTPVA
ncbi:MAG TPA: SAM-dependent methyltransferase [Streptosporangiaceae bacterium]